MIILSDNQITTKKFLDENHFKPNDDDSKLPQSLENLSNKIFLSGFTQKYKSISSDYWNYLLISQYARESQFDIINKLISSNSDIPDKLLCLAESGDGFHGFRNRTWSAKKGNIHLTLYFKPKHTFKNFHAGLLIVAAVAVLQTIDAVPGLTDMAKTKWVNDIVINNSKICGIITQSFSTGSKISGAVVGIGINVLEEPNFTKDKFTSSATCIKKISNNSSWDLSTVFKSLIINLSNAIQELENDGFNKLYKIYCERSAVLNKNVEIYSDPINGEIKLLNKGKVLAIKENLELILENNPTPIKNGRLSFLS